MTTRTVIYAGRRRGVTRPIVYLYIDPESGSEWVFSKPLVSTNVGYIIKVTEAGEGSFYTTGERAPRVVGFAENEQVLQWETLDRGAYEAKAAADAAKRQAKRAEDQSLDHHLSALARAAVAMSWRDREAFITYVSNRIRAGL